jgi:hypothetical protein
MSSNTTTRRWVPFLRKLAIVASSTQFATGSTISQTGIYSVFHVAHRLPKEVFLVKDGVFPRCSRCIDPAIFALVVPSDVFVDKPVHVKELPVMDDDAADCSRK